MNNFSKNILFLSDILGEMGGAERNLFILASHLRNRHYKVSIACLQGGKVLSNLHAEGFPVLNLNISRIYTAKGIRSFFKLIVFIRKKNISVILTYHESSDFLGALIVLLTGIPVISSRRDLGFNLKNRHRWCYRFINPLFARILTVSKAVKAAVIDTQRAEPLKITVIYNGVDLKFISDSIKGKQLWTNRHGVINLCCIANIRSIKGHIYLLKAVELIKKYNFDFCLYLVGQFDKNDEYYKILQETIHSLQIEDHVVFTGIVPSTNIFEFLQKMDISVLPSLSEGMPNSLLEAMAAGLPVVATAVGGSAEVVCHGETGYLVPERDAQKLADALLVLIKDISIRKNMAKKGVKRFETLFSAETMTDRYEDIIRYVTIKKTKKKLYRQWKQENIFQSIKQFGKCFVATILFYGGVIKLFRKLQYYRKRTKVSILCMHDVVNNDSKWNIFDIATSSEHFVKILETIKHTYSIVKLEKASSLIVNEEKPSEDTVAITFDDCYRSFNKEIFEHCTSFNIPFAIFLNTNPLDKKKFLLYDLLIYIATSTWHKTVKVPFMKEKVFLLDSKPAIRYFVKYIFDRLQYKSFVEWNKEIRKLANYLDVNLRTDILSNHFLSWKHIHRLYDSGVTIGAHTVTHPLLTSIADHECYQEIYGCKQRIEDELQDSINVFAYPYGHEKSYNKKVIQTVARSGFKYAFTLEHEKQSTDPFTIGRKNISQGQYLSGDGSFCKALFELELCGLGDIVFGRRLLRFIYD